MRARVVSFSSLIAAALFACGGASESPLFSGDGGGRPADSGVKQDAPPDVAEEPDVTPDVARDVMPIMDTRPPPPVDTGPPDTGPHVPPVFCGFSKTRCAVPGQDCCVNTQNMPASYECQDTSSADSCITAGNTAVFCDNTADCPSGDVCCGTENNYGSQYLYVRCQPSCTSTTVTKVVFCDQAAMPSICAPLGLTCLPSKLLPGYYVCTT